MENEKIFVVVPVYKVEAYLERCIDSILSQTYTNWELVLVDDGSPDNCPAICDRYAAAHENITVIHQENGGVSVARNAGVEYAFAHGDPEKDWINFVDSDDFVHPKYLEYLHRAAKETGVEVSICGFIRTSTSEIDSENEDLVYETLLPEEFWVKDRVKATVAWGKLYRLSCFDQIRYPIGNIHEDEFTTYKLLFSCSKVAHVNMQLYFYFINSTSITHTQWTPKRMLQLDALAEQVTYFRENGFRLACCQSCRALLQNSIKQQMYAKFLHGKHHTLVVQTTAWRNKAFRLYAEEVGLRKAVVYWFRTRFVGPARRVLSKESLFSFLKRKIKKMLHIP